MIPSEQQELPFSLKEKLCALRNALEAQNPGYATILSEVHVLTKQHPEYVYALSDEEFQTIIQGLGKYTNVVIETNEKGKKKMSAKDGMLLSEDSV